MQFHCSFIGKIAFWQWSHLRPFSDMDFWMHSWCPFGSLLAPFGLHMPPCWLRLASFWRPFASFSINSGSFWSFGHHFTRRGATFVSISNFGGTNLHQNVIWEPCFAKQVQTSARFSTLLVLLWSATFLRHQISSKFTLRQPTSQSI